MTQRHHHSIAGPHPGGAEQMGVDRRRDLGQDHRAGAQPARGQGLRARPRPHRQRLRRRIRRIQVSVTLVSLHALSHPAAFDVGVQFRVDDVDGNSYGHGSANPFI